MTSAGITELRIAVGTLIAERRPHRSVRAQIRAYGSYLGWLTVKRVSRSGLDSRPLLPSRTPSRPCDALLARSRERVDPVSRFPRFPPLAPAAPPPVARICSSASQLL